MAYQIEIFDRSQLEAFRLTFQKLAPTANPADQARREWWCFQNPNGGVFAIIRTEDGIAATCYLGGKRIILNDQEMAAFEIGETATEPAHQRKGLFTRIGTACVDYARSHGDRVVYGTPNNQATPGWIKQGFEIVRDNASWLYLIICPAYWLRLNIYAINKLFGRKRPTELTAEQYIQETLAFSRLSVSSRPYLQWRLVDSPSAYRFFKRTYGTSVFLCASKIGGLGRFPIIIASECFFDGRKPSIRIASSMLRETLWTFYDPREYAGIYIHGFRPSGLRRYLHNFSGVVPHRQLPVCVQNHGSVKQSADWFKHFQLSDCDIG
jgi:GNAT superfamily N-acetyltransferase